MIENTSKWGRTTAVKRYAEGGVPQPPQRTISTMEALNRREAWERKDENSSVPPGYESARGKNEDGSDHGHLYIRPSKDGVPMSNRGGKVK